MWTSSTLTEQPFHVVALIFLLLMDLASDMDSQLDLCQRPRSVRGFLKVSLIFLTARMMLQM